MSDSMYAKTPAQKRRSGIVAAGRWSPDLGVTGVAYRMADIDKAEARIKRECPSAHIHRANFNWCLWVEKPDKSEQFIVFETGRDFPTVLGDLDKIIAALNQK